MITENDKQHYLAVKRLNALLKKRLNVAETIVWIVLNYLKTRKPLKITSVNHFDNLNLNQ